MDRYDYAGIAFIAFMILIAFPALLRQNSNYNEYQEIVSPFMKHR